MLSALFITSLCTVNPFDTSQRLPFEVVPVREVAPLDYAKLFEEDITRDKNGLPLRFAQPTEVSITPSSHGIWEQLDNGK
ncbi:MAG: hypothetical protein ACKVIO_05845, partial [Phycisphaerales bacterium]